MRHFVAREWRYIRNQTGTYTVCPVERKPGREVVAIVMR